MSDTPFGNESITKRFEEAAQALEELSRNVEQLSEHEATQQVAADNISDASRHFAEFTTAAQTVAGLISDANARVAAALDTAETFLKGTDLSQMQAEVAAMKEETTRIVKILEESLLAQMQTEMKAIQDQTTAITKILEESLRAAEDRETAAEQEQKELEKHLADLRASHHEQALQLTVMQTQIASLPEKVRKKHGL